MNPKHALALIFALCAPLAWPQAPATLLDQAQNALKNKQYLHAANLYGKASALSPDDTEFPYHSASAYAMQGNANAAFEWLGRAMQRGFIDSAMLEKDEHFKSLHADPRWNTLLEKLRGNQKAWQQIWESSALNTPFQPNLSEDEKVAGLSKFWSEVKYNFVYTEKLNQINWDGLYLQYLPKVRASSSTLAYYLLLQELCAKIQDGHTNIAVPEQLEDEVYSRPAINTHLVENKVLIKDVMTDELQQKGISVGMEIIKVNGISAKEWGERMVAPWQSASTTQDLAVRTYRYGFLAGSPGQALELVLQDQQGKTIPLTLPRENWEVRKNWKKINSPPFEFKLLEGKVAYVALNGFGNSAAVDAYLKAFPEISKASALILDLRKNGGGNSDQGYRVLATLSKKPFQTSNWSTRNYKPAFRAWQIGAQSFGETGSMVVPDKAHYFGKPVLVLTGASTYSAAEDFAVAFDSMQRGTLVGEPTGGSTGQPLRISLPGGGSARICTKRDSYPNGRTFVGSGVQPGKLVQPTVADVRAGKDTVLAAALELLKAGPGK